MIPSDPAEPSSAQSADLRLPELSLHANRLLAQASYQEAEPLLRALVARGSSDALVYGNLAAICAMDGRFEEVERLLPLPLFAIAIC